MTPDQLATIMPFGAKRAVIYAPLLTATMSQYEIDTPRRQAAFLAQVGHESGSLKYTLELASGDAYEWKKDLGNSKEGDGRRYKGRGLIQVTGRANYTACGAALGLDLVEHPELLELPENASLSAGWYWSTRNLNQYADANKFAALTKAINGGYNGIDDRIQIWLAAMKELRVLCP